MKNKKIKIVIIGIIALILATIGLTYAYWLVTKTQDKENVISSACLDISISGEKNDITLSKQTPLADGQGLILTPYEFTVTNNCNTPAIYQITLEAVGNKNTALSTTTIKYSLDNVIGLLSDQEETNTTINGAYESRKLTMGILASKGEEGASKSYKLRLWIDNDTPISEVQKTFTSKVSVTTGQGIGPNFKKDTLAYTITNDAINKEYLYFGKPNLEKITEDTEYGMYATQDDYGTSYYFRGDITNNYVKLGEWQESKKEYYLCWAEGVIDSCVLGPFESLEACELDPNAQYMGGCVEKELVKQNDPMYWRIVRINGDSSIRLIYDGTSMKENGATKNSSVGNAKYNLSYDNINYLGYTYKDVNNNTEIDSNIKSELESWYVKNLKNSYSKYLADSIFCNDRGISNKLEYSNYLSNVAERANNNSPSLLCANKNDRYTVADTIKGNGLLSEPIGLITVDELIYAGTKGNIDGQSSNYIFSNTSFWTMSPARASEVYSGIYYYVSSGYPLHSNADISYSIRPVINLKADVEFTGTGTIDDPYVIVTN